MTSALIGHTGFVGSNLARQMQFDEFYNSKNAEAMRGKSFDLVICAGAPGRKWYANEHPKEDEAAICQLLTNLRSTNIRELVLISTVDAILPQDVYGGHRADLESILRTYHQQTSVIRLPALFGPGLRKNALYDLMAEQRLDEIAPNAVYQWYPLRRLAADIERVRGGSVRTVNFLSEPITMEEIRRRFFPRLTIGPERPDAPVYFLPNEHSDFWLTRAEIMDEMGNFLAGRS